MHLTIHTMNIAFSQCLMKVLSLGPQPTQNSKICSNNGAYSIVINDKYQQLNAINSALIHTHNYLHIGFKSFE